MDATLENRNMAFPSYEEEDSSTDASTQSQLDRDFIVSDDSEISDVFSYTSSDSDS
jgi:hypothetical protein